MRWLIPALILIPAAELAILIWTGGKIGIITTFLLIILTGTAGAFLAKKQGLKVIKDIQEKMARMEPPGDSLIRGAFILVGGVMLLSPGFLTDLFGLSLLFGPTQAIYKPILYRFIQKRMKSGRIIVM